jgi:hypothetical protein
MKHTITTQGPGAQLIVLDYSDEGVDFVIDRLVTGSRADAELYVPAFDLDVRANFSSMFPPPVYPEINMEEVE